MNHIFLNFIVRSDYFFKTCKNLFGMSKKSHESYSISKLNDNISGHHKFICITSTHR